MTVILYHSLRSQSIGAIFSLSTALESDTVWHKWFLMMIPGVLGFCVQGLPSRWAYAAPSALSSFYLVCMLEFYKRASQLKCVFESQQFIVWFHNGLSHKERLNYAQHSLYKRQRRYKTLQKYLH